MYYYINYSYPTVSTRNYTYTWGGSYDCCNCEEEKTSKEIANDIVNKVIFSDPATIVYWKDGTKTVVKADGEPFDKEKGFLMAYFKYINDNKGKYMSILNHIIDNAVDTKSAYEKK